jgi:hypothetical protein
VLEAPAVNDFDREFSLIWRRHQCRWRATNLGLCSALRAFEQGGIFIAPHLLWHRAFEQGRIFIVPHLLWHRAFEQGRIFIVLHLLWHRGDLYYATPAVTQGEIFMVPYLLWLKEGSLLCHTCCDIWSQFSRSHHKVPPLLTNKRYSLPIVSWSPCK